MKECNIVKDLLPLYIEELCSEDSRQYVEEHLKTCEQCKESFTYLKYSELCVEAVEKKEINAFKKLEKWISGRILISYFLFLVAIVIGAGVLLCTVPQAPVQMYYILLPSVMLATGFTFHNVSMTDGGSKKTNIWFVPQGIMILSSCILVFYMIFAVKENHIPFGIPVNKLGPVMDFLLRGSIILSLIIFITHLCQVGRKRIKYSMWCNLSMLCIFLNLMYDNFLHQMFDPQTAIEYLVKNTVELFLVYVIMSLLMWVILERKKDR